MKEALAIFGVIGLAALTLYAAFRAFIIVGFALILLLERVPLSKIGQLVSYNLPVLEPFALAPICCAGWLIVYWRMSRSRRSGTK
jgi:hypothetical protein